MRFLQYSTFPDIVQSGLESEKERVARDTSRRDCKFLDDHVISGFPKNCARLEQATQRALRCFTIKNYRINYKMFITLKTNPIKKGMHRESSVLFDSEALHFGKSRNRALRTVEGSLVADPFRSNLPL